MVLGSSLKDFRQDKEIKSASSAANKASRKVEDFGVAFNDLSNKIDLLALKCEALWDVIKDNTELSDEQIKIKIDQMYEKHGVVNGKFKKNLKNTLKCSSCGRPVDKKTQKCLYCNLTVVKTEIFL